MGYEIVDEPVAGAKIKVIGVGGGGGNALNGIIAQGIRGNVEYIAVNTDAQALKKFDAENTIQIGRKLTKGLGAGAKPEIGESSAQESKDEIAEKIKDADMVFITAGMGGGTGTGAAPVIAEIARELNKLTIGVVTKPFKFEGIKKMDRAEKCIEALKQNVDALIVIPNQNLIDTDMKNLTMAQAYAISDNVLKTDVIAIAEIITRHDEINVDFADVTTILTNAGQAHIAIGHGEGKDKVQDILNQDNWYFTHLYRNGIGYRWAVKRDDQKPNGELQQLFSIARENDDDDKDMLHEGDRLHLELRAIDQRAYDYLYSMQIMGNTGTNPLPNFSGGCLGYFSAYSEVTMDFTYHEADVENE